ncbi:MAG: TonB-dependent receptor [Bacteroidia bacterium]|nr:TonB-dependent receptor [Bacteroidia bacterium]MDW8157850.1 TonB-dependent receptor [Bacteroidia bacterium]
MSKRIYAQKNVTISGYIRDSLSGENLSGVVIQARPTPLGAISNNYGYYSLTIPAGNYELHYSSLGYRLTKITATINKDTVINVHLVEEAQELETIVIEEEKITDIVNTTQMSVNTLQIETIKQLPAIFGEVDVLKVVQLLPGIKAGTEGTSGFFVRGGSNDQNLILLDDAVVYNAAHMGGLFSVFNSDAVKGIKIYRGDFPANYGGRLSSVLDVQMKEGNNRKLKATGGIGLISSRITLEVPVQKNRSSLLLAGRRTYVDLFTRLINAANESKPNYTPLPNYYFYDLNLKANYQISDRDRVYLSGFFSSDAITLSLNFFSFDFSWQNTTTAIRWNHLFNRKLFLNTTAIFSNYIYSINNEFADLKGQLNSKINDWVLKLDFEYFPSPAHTIRLGANYIYHTFNPSSFNAQSRDQSVRFEANRRLYGTELATYIADDWELSERFRLNYGLRFSGFVAREKFYSGAEPRLALRYKLSDSIAIKASYARMYQYIHLASSSTISLPTDVWYPSTNRLGPQSSDQIACGFSWVVPFISNLVITNELYYKWLHNQIEFRENAIIFANPRLDEEFVFGKGYSYGNELLIEKKEGKFTGWLAYTLSWTNRLFTELNKGRPFPYRYDRRHDLSIVLGYQVSKRLNLSATFTFRTGEAITLPKSRFFLRDIQGVRNVVFTRDSTGRFIIDPGVIIPEYQERNSFRLPVYHRLDLSATWKFKPKKGESDINISIYNVYNRANPFFLYFDEDRNAQRITTSITGRIIALFPIIPSITYNFKF